MSLTSYRAAPPRVKLASLRANSPLSTPKASIGRPESSREERQGSALSVGCMYQWTPALERAEIDLFRFFTGYLTEKGS